MIKRPRAEPAPPAAEVGAPEPGVAAGEQPPTPAPEPVPPPAPEPAPPAPEPAPPTPTPQPPVPGPTPQLSLPSQDSEATPELEPAVLVPSGADGPREWNVWDLERVVRERAAEDAPRGEELAFLLLQLRRFASADGRLPSTFDPVVRESFGPLLYTPA